MTCKKCEELVGLVNKLQAALAETERMWREEKNRADALANCIDVVGMPANG